MSLVVWRGTPRLTLVRFPDPGVIVPGWSLGSSWT